MITSNMSGESTGVAFRECLVVEALPATYVNRPTVTGRGSPTSLQRSWVSPPRAVSRSTASYTKKPGFVTDDALRAGAAGGRIGWVLRKIDCVMVRVAELDSAAEYYTRVFGLRELWRDEVSVGMGMAETDAEVVLHSMELPPDPFGNAVCLLDTSKGLR
jgi:hypothetical protein